MPSINRRTLLSSSGSIAAATALSSFISSGSSGAIEPAPASSSLSFNSDGRFKIIQFNDTQDDHLTDRRTLEFMERALDEEKPDFALINGDVITGGPKNNEQVYQAINNVVLPMETRGIPWALTFGNHDEDAADEGGATVRAPEMVEFIRQYRHNLNTVDDELYGSSNSQLLVNGNQGSPAFVIWLLDSGRYAPDNPAGQSTDGLKAYDWVRPEQIRWYEELSRSTEATYHRKIPGLMFFHIPLFEHDHMWHGRQFGTDKAQHREAVERHGIVGEKNEDVYTGLFNSGLYAAVYERGDVLGMYCGHDHINTFMGNYYGVELGYGPGTGFGPYGLRDGTWSMHTLRGCRVFELDENTERVYTSTRTVFAKDYGIDMNPKPQKLEKPLDIPDYVSY